MRRTIFVASTLALTIGTPSVFAQSSVSLSGLMDAGITYVNNSSGHANPQFVDGVDVPNLIIFTGKEDLGGGTAMIFQLEDQYLLGTGSWPTNKSLFTWESMAGFQNQQFGTLTFGNQRDFMIDSVFLGQNDGAEAHDGVYGIAGGPFIKLNLPNNPTGSFNWDRMGFNAPISNSVKYASPIWNGFSGGALYSFGGIPGSIGSNSGSSFGLNYANASFGANAAITNVKQAVAGVQASVRNWGVGAHYYLGNFTTAALFTAVHNGANGGSVWEGQLSEFWQINAAWGLSTAYVYMKGNAVVNNNHAHEVSSALSYALSKRTVVYATAVYQRTNRGANALINGLNSPGSAASGPSQLLGRIGFLTHF
ncbi:porin [Paraburkholderia sediminicola]|uniref:porin n=1 Tax=Paraburkholderia sediminicola TaxID=458836 RepID=UPI0038BCF033